jgi:Histidine kinase-, DNA gyrase B-, and HSP90-like ATPase
VIETSEGDVVEGALSEPPRETPSTVEADQPSPVDSPPTRELSAMPGPGDTTSSTESSSVVASADLGPPSTSSGEDVPTSVPVAAFVVGADNQRDEVPVVMSLAIIERFSEGLYSSPNKTFEELVSNSYDAGASIVWVYMPEDLKADDPTTTIVVVDNGASMDVAGLRDLWKIGESRKREPKAPVRAGRPPIGKFGIGKLATYVLANELTYLVLKDGIYRAITMDYGQVRGGMGDPHRLSLIVAELTEDDAQATLTAALAGMTIDQDPRCLKPLFDGSTESWTAAILTRLKKPARDIQQGRLKWVLSNSLPLNPAFTLFYDDQEIEPSKAKGEEVWSYVVGQSNQDELVSAPRGEVTTVEVAGEKHPALKLPLAGRIWGTARLFLNALERGRSEDRARSHGYFVRVRQRLINLDDPTFDVGVELHHGTFTRFNMVVNADDLDDLVASPRESLQDSPALRELKQYMLAVFNRARSVSASQDESDTMPLLKSQGRIANPPPALSQGPLRRTIRRAASSEGLAEKTLGLRDAEIAAANELAANNADLVEKILLEEDTYEGRLVRYDPLRKAAVLNLSHPFINNYINQKGAAEPLKLLGLTELLTEAYMLDEDVPADVVGRVVARRDRFLRDLVKRNPRSALVVARHLRESSNNEKELEDAVADAFEILGFGVRRIGGTGGTDGIAVARLGRRGGNRSESYALTYDAKSSGKEAQDVLTLEESDFDAKGRRKASAAPRIQAATAHTSILRVHREKAKERYSLLVEPEYTLLVAPGFQGDGIDASLIGDICKNDGITPITVKDLARLVELFPLRWVSPMMLKDLFKAHSPQQAREFVDRIEALPAPTMPPVQQIVDLLVRYSERRAPVTVDAISAALYESSGQALDLTADDVVAIVRGLAALAPNSIYFDGVMVALNASPENLLHELHDTLGDYPDRLAGTYIAVVPVIPSQSTGRDSS